MAILGTTLSALAIDASAAPTVTFKARAVPITGFPRTGNVSGAGAAIQTELTINGSEYGGYPPPLIGWKLYPPTGVSLHTAGFPVCPQQVIEAREPERCPKDSKAGPTGRAGGYVVFGTERVPETMSIEAFYALGGGLDLVVLGHTPASIEIVAPGQFTGPPFGLAASFDVPLIATVPGAPFASITRIVTTIGSAIKRHNETLSYVTMPTACPAHRLAVKAEAVFAENGNEATPVTVPVTSYASCPGEAPLPETAVPGTGGVVTAPSNQACLSRRDFTIHVLQIKGLTYRQVSVDVNGHRVKTLQGSRISAPVDLRGLPKGHYTVKITVTTGTGRRITGTRSYHTCAAKPLPGRHHRL